jgi:hypothetical protein
LPAGRAGGEHAGVRDQQAVARDLELVAVTPACNELGEAVEAIMLAVRALVLRFGLRGVCPWVLAVFLTTGCENGDRWPHRDGLRGRAPGRRHRHPLAAPSTGAGLTNRTLRPQIAALI